jgi:small conductance mechanosensitive channel
MHALGPSAVVRIEEWPMKRIVYSLLAIVLTTFCLTGQVIAQDPSGRMDLQPLPEEVAARFDRMLADIDDRKEDIESIESRLAEFEGTLADILSARRDIVWTSMFSQTLALADEVAAQEADGIDVSAYRDHLVEELGKLPDQTYGLLQRLRDRVEFPTSELPPEQFVVADQRLFKQIRELDDIFRALISYVHVAEKFGLDASEERAFIEHELTNSAANRSVFLEMALNDVQMLRSTNVTLPGNENLSNWLRAAQTRVQMTARAMQDMVALMSALDLETRQYRQQVLQVTGEITTDVLDVGIVAGLLSQWGKASLDLLTKEGPRLVFRLLLFMFILLVFFQLAKLVQKAVDRALGSARVHISHLLRRMIVSSVRNLVVLFGLLIAISQLGVSLGPVLAGLGIVGFIIGFALQDSLSNFASGMMILIYRPFDVGDVVEAGGVSGKVSHMSLVNTTFMTFDNQRLVVPNNLIWQSVITNVTAQHQRRIDLIFGISYGDDIEKAENVLQEIVEEHEAVLDDPAPMIKVQELGESSVNFIVRPWVRTADYWDTYWDLTKAVKLRFDQEGISIPFPQRDVHVIEQT